MGDAKTRQLFVNLAVSNLDETVDFFTKLGFRFNPQFTDETATSMIVGDNAFVMLLDKKRFGDFAKKKLADSKTQTEAIISVSAESREEVDELADKALAAGGSKAGDSIDMGFMYSRSFYDLDGHQWEFVWMDPTKVEPY